MARKKEPKLVDLNRDRIIKVAEKLFLENGIEKTKMDDLAAAAGMSKSTLYVYFKSKEEVMNSISLEAMKHFKEQLSHKIQKQALSLYEKYMAVCHALVEFYESNPLSFQIILEKISVDDKSLKKEPVLMEIYEIGEQINQMIFDCFEDLDIYKSKQELLLSIFVQWGSIYGLIVLADNKENYIQKSMNMTKEQFLKIGFETLYQSIKPKSGASEIKEEIK